MIRYRFYSKAVPLSRKKKRISWSSLSRNYREKKDNVISSIFSKLSTHLQGNLSEGRNFLGLRLRIPTGVEGPGRGGHGQWVWAIFDPRRSERGPLRWLTTGARHPRSASSLTAAGDDVAPAPAPP